MSLVVLSWALSLLLSVLVGVSLGLLGGGGSILTLPLFVYGFGLGTHDAIAASLFVVGVTSAVALVSHARRGNVSFRTGLVFGGSSMIGAFGAGRVAHLIPAPLLLVGFGGMMLVTAVTMMRPERSPTPKAASRKRTFWLEVMLEGILVGAVTGLVGAGGGFLVVPALVLLGGLPMERAVGTSLLVITMKSFAALVGHVGTAELSFGLAGTVALAAVVGSLLGGRWVERIPEKILKRAFGWFVVVMGTFLLAQEVPRLLGYAFELSWAWPWLLLLLAPVVVLAGSDLARLRAAQKRFTGSEAAGKLQKGKERAVIFRQLFDAESSTYTYLLADEDTREAVLIDPVLEQVGRDTQLLEDLGLRLSHALDTHVHADHVTALGRLRDLTGCRTGLSKRAGVGCSDASLEDGAVVLFGRHRLEVRETPGHTDGCLTYVLHAEGMAFTGDALLIRGSGRTDFQQGSAPTLFRSVRERIFTLPDATLLYPGHDYKGRTVTTVGEEKRHNPRLGVARTEAEFVAIMNELQLAYPKRIDEALPRNLACGVPQGVTADPAARSERTWAPLLFGDGGVPELRAEWVANHGGEARLVDVREATEFDGELGHVAAAELVPLAQLPVAAGTWDRARPLIIICRSGKRSGVAARELVARGFTRVASMRGGMLAWRELRLPVA